MADARRTKARGKESPHCSKQGGIQAQDSPMPATTNNKHSLRHQDKMPTPPDATQDRGSKTVAGPKRKEGSEAQQARVHITTQATDTQKTIYPQDAVGSRSRKRDTALSTWDPYCRQSTQRHPLQNRGTFLRLLAEINTPFAPALSTTQRSLLTQKLST
ncbi:Hypothetical predicted protein [Pelobates cultripes]|uniref:Uncharacterized protein n=1 Tax=Pelobates cultripes TaxID=61616 RepID=A0AAD1W2Q8_PELCU|nr:Hypothetical predicted protein [Pelobates cultripes]